MFMFFSPFKSSPIQFQLDENFTGENVPGENFPGGTSTGAVEFEDLYRP